MNTIVKTYEQKKQDLTNELNARIQSVKDAVMKRLIELGHIPSGSSNPLARVDDTWIGLEIRPEHKSLGYYTSHDTRTGKLRMSLGNYPSTKNYPEPKNGFDIEKTVERILAIIKEQKVALERKVNSEAAAQQRLDFFQSICESISTSNMYYQEARKGELTIKPYSSQKVSVTFNADLNQIKAVMVALGISE